MSGTGDRMKEKLLFLAKKEIFIFPFYVCHFNTCSQHSRGWNKQREVESRAEIREVGGVGGLDVF